MRAPVLRRRKNITGPKATIKAYASGGGFTGFSKQPQSAN